MAPDHGCEAGWILETQTYWRHRPAELCAPNQLEASWPCNDPEHDDGCVVVPITTGEVARRCEVCYPPKSSAAAAAAVVDEITGHVPARLPYADT